MMNICRCIWNEKLNNFERESPLNMYKSVHNFCANISEWVSHTMRLFLLFSSQGPKWILFNYTQKKEKLFAEGFTVTIIDSVLYLMCRHKRKIVGAFLVEWQNCVFFFFYWKFNPKGLTYFERTKPIIIT